MEDSEQRRKRLREMRVQADQAEASGNFESPIMPGSLSNPLVEPQDRPYAPPRFDFYTDPMAAFSSNRKRSDVNFQATPTNFAPPNFGGSPNALVSSPRPESMNPQMNPSPTQVSPVPYRGPVWNGPRGPAPYYTPSHPTRCPSPGFGPSGGSFFNSLQGITHQPSHSPNPNAGYRYSPNPSPSPSPSPGPSPGRGRGRGCWNNARSPDLGWSGRRGLDSRGRHSNQDSPSGFYKKSMVEDPWKFLRPVLWNTIDAPSGTLSTLETSKSRQSKSLSTQREGPSGASKSKSEPSLAEYLAAAFNEASNDAENL